MIAALQELYIFYIKWNFYIIQGNSGNDSILKRPFDIVTILLLLSTMFIYIFKGLVSITEWFHIKCNAVILYSKYMNFVAVMLIIILDMKDYYNGIYQLVCV